MIANLGSPLPNVAIGVLPKVHLHVHLESTVRWTTLVEIASKNGVFVPPYLHHGQYVFKGFADFLYQNSLVRDCLRQPEDFHRIALEYCEDEAREGTLYSEVYFSAAAHGERLGAPDMPLSAVLDGLTEGCAKSQLSVQVLLDHSRRRSVELAWQTVELAVRYADRGVVGVGLASDDRIAIGPFAEVFVAARRQGLRVVHHAGEGSGAESIRQAIQVGGAERIAHGFRALEDKALVCLLRESRIPLDVCPSSNVALGFVPSLIRHPLPDLLDAGLVVSISTDIPALLGTSLTQEYRKVQETFSFGAATMKELARTAVEASFASSTRKELLHRAIADSQGLRSSSQLVEGSSDGASWECAAENEIKNHSL